MNGYYLLDYYLKLPYAIHINPNADGNGYDADIPDLPGCKAHGSTINRLMENLEEAKRQWLESSLTDGLPIPEPTFTAHSSTQHEQPYNELTVRVPRSLYRQLMKQANREGVSLLKLVEDTLAERVGVHS